jgi:hypothetical protein
MGNPRRSMKMAGIILSLLGLAGMASAQAGSDPNQFVVPPGAAYAGRSYAEWSAAWWQWLLVIPKASSPLLDTTGAFAATGQSGPVWFLADTTGGSATRTCTIPAGKAVLFPLINASFWKPCGGATIEELHARATAAMDEVTILEAAVDGVRLRDLWQHRATSGPYSFTGSPDEILPCQAGPHDAAADGFWILLAPLPVGQHEIHFCGIVLPRAFVTEVRYLITVVP